MRNPKGRALPNTFSMYFAMLAVYCLDIFVFQSDITILGNAFFSYIFSLIILYMYTKVTKSSVRTLGISRRKQKVVAGIIYGALFSLIPLLLVMSAEFVYYKITDASAINLTFSPPGVQYIKADSIITPVGVAAIYIVTTFFGAAFKEFFFRGFMLKKMNKAANFFKANLVQSLFNASFILPLMVRNFITGRYNTITPQFIVVVMLYFVHETLSAVKRGLMTRVSGSTYISTFEHFIFVFFSSSVFISGYGNPEYVLRLLAIQLASFVMVLAYYFAGMKRINTKKLKEKQEEEEARQRKEARRKEREELYTVKSKLEPLEEISPEKYRKLSAEAQRHGNADENPDAPLENTVFIEEAVQEKPKAQEAESEVDDFLKQMTREMRRHEDQPYSDEITEDFDSDYFLETYGNGKKHHSRHHHRHGGHSHTNQSGSKPKTESEKKTSSGNPKTEPVKKKLSKKPKRTLSQKINALGGVDDSSSNDLI